MYKVILTFRLVLLCALTISLTACLGGTIAQQVLRSVATSVADNAIGSAIEKRENAARNQPSELGAFVANSSFREVHPVVESLQSSHQMSQNTRDNVPFSADENQPAEGLAEVKIVPLVRVEILNLLVGDEKKAVFERARLIGALNLPKQREWPMWHVATGMPEGDSKPITFLIPPQIGKLPSGVIAVVELAGAGELNMLRHQTAEPANPRAPKTPAPRVIQRIIQAQSSQ